MFYKLPIYIWALNIIIYDTCLLTRTGSPYTDCIDNIYIYTYCVCDSGGIAWLKTHKNIQFPPPPSPDKDRDDDTCLVRECTSPSSAGVGGGGSGGGCCEPASQHDQCGAYLMNHAARIHLQCFYSAAAATVVH